MQPTVLVIDDDRTSRRVLVDLLNDAGFRTAQASGGEAGCRIACEMLPDVVLVDLVMPGFDGLEVCRQLRSRPALTHVPLLLMASRQDVETSLNPFLLGADDYIVTPVDQHDLSARIKANLLKKQFFRSKEYKARHYDALLEISETVTASTDFSVALKEIVRKISNHLSGVDRCSIALIREHEDCGYVMATSTDIQRPAFRIELRNYPEIRQVMATGRPLLIEDIAHSPLLADILPALDGHNINAILVFPVIHAQRVIGAMIVRIAHPGAGVAREDVAFCRLASNIVVTALKSTGFFDLIWEEAESLRHAKLRLEQNLKIKEVYEHLFENASEGLIAFAESGQVLYANRRMLEMIGQARTGLEGASLAALFGENVETMLLASLDRKASARSFAPRLDIPFTTPAGETRIFSIDIGGKPGSGAPRVATFRDVTDKRKMEKDLLRTKAALEEANTNLIKADQRRAEFLNTAVHELRTPLTIVGGYCSLLSETDQSRLTDDQRSYVKEATAAADRMADLINNLLDLSRLESGKSEFDVRPRDLVITVNEFLRDYESLLQGNQLRLRAQLPETCMALFDDDRIYRVLVNLFGNAVKFTPAGGEIRIFLAEEENFVHFRIEDTGKGIPEESLPHLFKEFYQAGRRDSRTGSGLGLYICRKIIESHQGKIWVESRVGQGSRFTFSLPRFF